MNPRALVRIIGCTFIFWGTLCAFIGFAWQGTGWMFGVGLVIFMIGLTIYATVRSKT